MVIDEHVPGKKNRKNILDEHVEFGMMSGPHP